jgi:hypothetical protein
VRSNERRRVARTVLLVGEGDAEEVLLRHLKGLYVERGSGLVVTIKNARGKGAEYVVDFAIRQSRNVAFDSVLAMFDTDTAWTERVRRQAARGKVALLPCEPCLEALLLQAFDHKTQGLNSQQLKQKFLREFGRPAHDGQYLRDADAAFFEQARRKAKELDVLLALLKA